MYSVMYDTETSSVDICKQLSVACGVYEYISVCQSSVWLLLECSL